MMMEDPPHPDPLPQGERGTERRNVEHRGWSVRMIAWSAALAAFLSLAAWGAANWRAFHLAYCRHLLRSDDVAQQGRGLLGIYDLKHLSPGLSVAEAKALLAPLKPVIELVGDERYDRQDNSLGFYPPLGAGETGRVCRYDCRPKGPTGPAHFLELQFHDEKLVSVLMSGGAF